MGELIAELLLLFEEFKFWKKKKERRKKEEREDLPKKNMIHPTVWITLFLLILIFLYKLLIIYLYPNPQEADTVKSIKSIEEILKKQKKDLGTYPKELKEIIRNNPLRKNINIDSWGNEFYYKLLNNGMSYDLRSKGKDGILNTADDIIGSNAKSNRKD